MILIFVMKWRRVANKIKNKWKEHKFILYFSISTIWFDLLRSWTYCLWASIKLAFSNLDLFTVIVINNIPYMRYYYHHLNNKISRSTLCARQVSGNITTKNFQFKSRQSVIFLILVAYYKISLSSRHRF